MSCKIHNIKFYNLEPKSVVCFAYESKSKKLALARLDFEIFFPKIFLSSALLALILFYFV